MDIKTLREFKKLTTEEKLAYVLGECDRKESKLLALWLAELEKTIK